MLITFQLAHEDRGRLIGKFGATIIFLRIKHQCNGILVHDDNKLVINHDDNHIVNNIVYDIEWSWSWSWSSSSLGFDFSIQK